jgi:hypothetical protein
VEVEAEGPDDAVLRLRAALGDGPDGAEVGAVEDLASGDDALERPFTIVR